MIGYAPRYMISQNEIWEPCPAYIRHQFTCTCVLSRLRSTEIYMKSGREISQQWERRTHFHTGELWWLNFPWSLLIEQKLTFLSCGVQNQWEHRAQIVNCEWFFEMWMILSQCREVVGVVIKFCTRRSATASFGYPGKDTKVSFFFSFLSFQNQAFNFRWLYTWINHNFHWILQVGHLSMHSENTWFLKNIHDTFILEDLE